MLGQGVIDCVQDIAHKNTMKGTAMQDLPQLIPLTELRRRAGAVVDKLPDEPRPVIVTSNGSPVAVMLSWQAWERIVNEATQ